MQPRYIAALDQGTTASRCILFDRDQNIVCVRQKEFAQHYPRPGWVEQDPEEIWGSQYAVFREAAESGDVEPAQIAAIGITNQRETAVVWEKKTGRPVCPAIVWQCRRTREICERLKRGGHEELVRSRTGLLIDAYFSATKLKWILDNIPGARKRAQNGELLFGTVDSWLIWNLTGGKVHATDRTNASRTMMYDIHQLCWDKEILDILDIPECMLPEVRGSAEPYGHTELYGSRIPITGVAGDQQAALFGQACFSEGQAKNTYGTGCFLLLNTGSSPAESKNGLLSTIAASADGSVQYALEGSVFMGGAVIDWLRQMGFIESAAQSEVLAEKAGSAEGVYLVPAFTGLGAPYWDMNARGTISGLTRGVKPEHIVRAGLEAMAYQTNDVLNTMRKDSGIPLLSLKTDGGASRNNFLMQFQADISNVEIMRPAVYESTALGAAYLAGLACGFWESAEQIIKARKPGSVFRPDMSGEKREKLLSGWKKAVERTLEPL